jgi:septal ring factor EnvC (AmiA/AmiB activator)
VAENEVTIRVEAEAPQPETVTDIAAAAAVVVAAAETAVAMAEQQTADTIADAAAEVADATQTLQMELQTWLKDQLNPLFSSIQTLTERMTATENQSAELKAQLILKPPDQIAEATPPEKPPDENADGLPVAESQALPVKKRRFL